jgi:uncharacterized membrane protein
MAGRVLPVVTVLWAALIVGAAWSDQAPAALGPVPRLLAAATYATGSVVCHQRPERSFHANGVQWPVCGRCAGLYLSAAAGVLLTWVAGRRASGVPSSSWRGILVAAAVPSALTAAIEWWNPAWSSTLVRAAAAVPLGAAVGALLTASLSFRVD